MNRIFAANNPHKIAIKIFNLYQSGMKFLWRILCGNYIKNQT
jgi:hypothetical protein